MFFGKKKLPVLTDSSCDRINLILKIAGVLTGIDARLKRFDFNTGRGQLYIGEKIQEFYCHPIDMERYNFATLTPTESSHDYLWYVVHLEEAGLVRISAGQGKNAHRRADGMPLWLVGNSASNRHEEPYWK